MDDFDHHQANSLSDIHLSMYIFESFIKDVITDLGRWLNFKIWQMGSYRCIGGVRRPLEWIVEDITISSTLSTSNHFVFHPPLFVFLFMF